MGLRINTNVASLAAQRQIGLSQSRSQGEMKALASGNRFDNPAESSADYSIAEGLRAQISGMKSATKNAENAQSFVQVAEGGLNEQNNILIRMRELSVQAASDTYSDQERELLQQEYGQLQQEMDRIALTTSFGSTKLLSGDSKEYEFQVGAYKGEENVIKYKADTNTRSGELGVDSLDISDRGSARDSLDSLDEAVVKIAQARANFGAIHSRLDSTINHGNVQVENLEAAHSRLADTNIAEAASSMYKQQALQQYQISVLDQANRFPGAVIRLVG